MDIPLNARVRCRDGEAGRSTCLILNPIDQRATHVVVANRRDDRDDHLVPIDRVRAVGDDGIALDCTLAELDALPRFTETRFVRHLEPHVAIENYYWMPYVSPETVTAAEYVERVPAGELAVHRGMPVRATDGDAGSVSELIVDQGGHVTHIVLRAGRLFGKHDVAIPLSAVATVGSDAVVLKLDRAGVEALPHVPVKRWWA